MWREGNLERANWGRCLLSRNLTAARQMSFRQDSRFLRIGYMSDRTIAPRSPHFAKFWPTSCLEHGKPRKRARATPHADEIRQEYKEPHRRGHEDENTQVIVPSGARNRERPSRCGPPRVLPAQPHIRVKFNQKQAANQGLKRAFVRFVPSRYGSKYRVVEETFDLPEILGCRFGFPSGRAGHGPGERA